MKRCFFTETADFAKIQGKIVVSSIFHVNGHSLTKKRPQRSFFASEGVFLYFMRRCPIG